MSEHHDERLPIAIPIAELKELATRTAEEMKGGPTPIPHDLRARFITVRAALFQRGIYDPVLVRFDTISAPRASTQEIGEHLATVAEAM